MRMLVIRYCAARHGTKGRGAQNQCYHDGRCLHDGEGYWFKWGPFRKWLRREGFTELGSDEVAALLREAGVESRGNTTMNYQQTRPWFYRSEALSEW
jgi:hypothetical protein